MSAVLLLAIGLVVSLLFAFTNGLRQFGIGGLLCIVLVSGVIWVGHIPLA